jgi:hypothetical protein
VRSREEGREEEGVTGVVGAPGVAGDALGELVDRLRGHRAPAEESPAARRGEGGGGGGNLVAEPWWRRGRRDEEEGAQYRYNYARAPSLGRRGG